MENEQTEQSGVKNERAGCMWIIPEYLEREGFIFILQIVFLKYTPIVFCFALMTM